MLLRCVIICNSPPQQRYAAIHFTFSLDVDVNGCGFSAFSGHAPRAVESCLFYHDFKTYFYILSNFCNHSNSSGWLITHFSVV